MVKSGIIDGSGAKVKHEIDKKPLSLEEQEELIRLMGRVAITTKENNGVIPKPIFMAWLDSFYANSAEVAFVRDQGNGPEVFLTQRPSNDPFSKGKHVTGSIIIPNQTLRDAIERVWRSEFGAKEELPPAEFVDFFERTKGTGPGQVARGQEIGFLFLVRVVAECPTTKGAFYPLRSMPDDILEHHKIMILTLKKYLKVNH